MNELMKKTSLWSMGLFIISMMAIVYFSMTKTIEISNVAQDEVSYRFQKTEKEALNEENNAKLQEPAQEISNKLVFDSTNINTDYLCIPLPEKTNSEGVIVENHYMDHKLFVAIDTNDVAFYKNTKLSGNDEYIIEGTYEITDDSVRLCFLTDGLYEYKTVMENGSLYISFLKPNEIYEKIVVIDPAHGGNDTGYISAELLEKDISLSVAKKVKALMDESDIKVYYTRMDDVNPSKEARISLANESKADMYIRIEADNKDDASIYGITSYYNEDFFIPGFGNVELADLMEKEVVTAVKGKALGLIDASLDDYTLIYSTVPSTIIKVGCMSNKQEAILLSREDYLDKIATGIYNGIMKGFE